MPKPKVPNKKITANKAASTTRGHMDAYLKRLERRFINDPNASEEFIKGARRAILMARAWQSRMDERATDTPGGLGQN